MKPSLLYSTMEAINKYKGYLGCTQLASLLQMNWRQIYTLLQFPMMCSPAHTLWWITSQCAVSPINTFTVYAFVTRQITLNLPGAYYDGHLAWLSESVFQ